VSGVATYSGCKINLPGTGYTLRASATGLTPATSTAFNVSGPAAQLVFTTAPGGANRGAPFGTQPVVTVEDAAGNTVTSDSSTVTLSITPPTLGNPKLSGCSGTESAGVVTFTGCSINKSSSGYSLTANDGALTPAISSTFTVN